MNKALLAVRNTAVKNSPQIFISLGIASLATSLILAIKSGPKVHYEYIALKKRYDEQLLQEQFDNFEIEEAQAFPSKVDKAKDYFKTLAPVIGPSIVAGVASVGFFLAANRVHVRRNEMLIAAYALSEKALATYKDKVIDEFGEKKHLQVMDSIAKDHVITHETNQDNILVTEYGNTKCYDAFSDRYFLSDIDKIRKAENIILQRILTDMYIPLNDFYSELGLPPTKYGDMFGWDANDLLPEINVCAILDSESNPCIALEYCVGLLTTKYQIL